MVKKTKFSTITAVIATIAAIAALGSIGGGIGQQQTALAQPVDLSDSLEDQIDVGGIGDTVRAILEQDVDVDRDSEFRPDECRALPIRLVTDCLEATLLSGFP
jgi:hypothetical protein